MIHFFRRVRQQLLTENKFSKYLIYALGEIVLVVIGILFALQVNNWNNKRLDNARTQDFLKKLEIQTESNVAQLNFIIDRLNNSYEKTTELTQIIGSDKTEDIDRKIDNLISNNTADYHLNLNLNAIIEARENGDLGLITNDSLRQTIYQLLTTNENVKERERITNDDLNSLFVPYLLENFNYRNYISYNTENDVGTSALYKGDNYKMLQDQRFENYIVSRMEYAKSNLDLYNIVREDLESILKQIHSNQ